MLVSVCVPAYERPELTAILISTVLQQTHTDFEICVTDDSTSSSVEEALTAFNDRRIRYRRNRTRLGLTGNLRSTLAFARGELLVVLGDDDFFATPDALATYCDVANRYPEAAFFYPNLVQVDLSGKTTAYHSYFRETRYLNQREPALEEVWLRSVQIAGMGFRIPGPTLASYFPEYASLFPQVSVTGKVLLSHGAVAIADNLVATRFSETQLGYQMATGAVAGSARENQGGAELMLITRDLFDHARPALSQTTFAKIERTIVLSFVGSLPNIKIFCGNSEMNRLVANMCEQSTLAKRSLLLRSVCTALRILPPPLLKGLIRAIKRSLVTFRNAKERCSIGNSGGQGKAAP